MHHIHFTRGSGATAHVGIINRIKGYSALSSAQKQGIFSDLTLFMMPRRERNLPSENTGERVLGKEKQRASAGPFPHFMHFELQRSEEAFVGDESQKDDTEKAPQEWWLRKMALVKDLRYKVKCRCTTGKELRQRLEAHRHLEGIYGYLEKVDYFKTKIWGRVGGSVD